MEPFPRPFFSFPTTRLRKNDALMLRTRPRGFPLTPKLEERLSRPERGGKGCSCTRAEPAHARAPPAVTRQRGRARGRKSEEAENPPIVSARRLIRARVAGYE